MIILKTKDFLVFLLSCIMFFIIPPGFSQGKFNPDSLLNQYLEQDDNFIKGKILYDLSEGYLYSDKDSAQKYSSILEDLAASTGNDTLLLDAWLMKGRTFRMSYEFDSSMLYLRKAIALADSTGDDKRRAAAHSHMGHTLHRLDRSEEGLAHYLESYDLYKRNKDSLGMCKALIGIGVIYMENSRFDSSVYYLLELVRISEEINNEELLGYGLVNLGASCYSLGDQEKAEEFMLRSIIMNKKLEQPATIALAYNVLGNIFYDMDSVDEALTYYESALSIYDSIGNRIGIAQVHVNIGNVFYSLNDFDQALKYYRMAKDIYEEIPSWRGYMLAYKNIGVMHEKKGNYRRSLAIYDSCLLINEEIGDLAMERDLYYNLSYIYAMIDDYESAYQHRLLYDQMKDSIFNIEKARTINDLQLKYESEKNKARILALEKTSLEKDLLVEERTSQRNIFLFAGIGIVVIILFISLYYRQKAVKDRVIAKQRIQRLEEEKKVLAAKALAEGQEEERKRIASELHDGLGVLLSTVKMQFSTIKDRSLENRPLIENATMLLGRAVADVRRISHNMMPGLLTKFGVFEAVDDLMEQISETGEVHVSVDIPGDEKRLPENQEIMIYRIVQEMVNNTLKHAEAKNIMVKMQLLPDTLDIVYSDDGKGFDVDEKLKSNTVGLQSIFSRVNFLNGDLRIESTPGQGTTYAISMPV